MPGSETPLCSQLNYPKVETLFYFLETSNCVMEPQLEVRGENHFLLRNRL